VSTAGTRIGLATAGTEPPPSDYFPSLKEIPPDRRAHYPEGPRLLGPGEFLVERRQCGRGVVEDTIRRCGEMEDGVHSSVERMYFQGWFSGLRPGVKPFLLRREPAGLMRRVTLEQIAREDWERTWEANGEGAVSGVPPLLEAWPGEEPDAVLPPLYPIARGLRGGAAESDSDSGPVRPHRPRVIEDRELVGSGRIDVRRIVHATAEEGAMEVDVEAVSDGSERPLSVYSDSEQEGVGKRPESRQPKPRKRARGCPRKGRYGALQASVPD